MNKMEYPHQRHICSIGCAALPIECERIVLAYICMRNIRSHDHIGLSGPVGTIVDDLPDRSLIITLRNAEIVSDVGSICR